MAYKWTEQEMEILQAMAKKGFKVNDIKKVLIGRTVEAIQIKAGSLGHSLNGSPPEIDMDAYARMMKGETKSL